MRRYFFLVLICFLSVSAMAQKADLEQYKGTYKFSEGSPTPQVEISIQNGALYAASSIGSAALTFLAKDTFSIPDHEGMAYFFRDKDGKVNAIRVEVSNMVLEGTKENGSLALYRRRSLAFTSK